ncbi:MAG: D-aminoacylase [Planctomycetes bacterium]|nr:D-aminoacylase [Planctomycetota bacterium]
MRIVFGPLLLVAMAALVPAQQDQPTPEFDLVLAGGTIIDGSGGDPVRADLGVRGGRIASIAVLAGRTATQTIDVTGRMIAPGFIDLHTHVDTDIVRLPTCDNFVRMGVTTIITGNCGSSVPDLAAHLRRLEQGGIGLNYGSLVGHGTIRSQVFGSENRAPTADELAAMGQKVDAAMRAGAFGMSTGLIYVPGTYATTEELIALAKVVATHGGRYVSHMRNENDHIVDSIAELLRIGREAALPVHVSHIKCTGKPNHGRAGEVLALLVRARADGQTVTADQYAYDASSTGLDVLFPTDALAIGREAFGKRLREDAAFRERMRDALFATMDRVGFGDFRYCRIASAAGHPELSGLTIPEAARRLHGSDDRNAQAQTAIDLFAAAVPKRVSMVYHAIGEADVATFLAADWIGIASDAGIRIDVGGDKPHPRGAGNNPRVLGRYARDQKILSLPLAVRKMTAIPAAAFDLQDRGTIAVGAHADLVVFDPATVADRATWSEPMLSPVGIDRVLVAGVTVVENDTVTKARPGQVLRHRSRAVASEAGK